MLAVLHILAGNLTAPVTCASRKRSGTMVLVHLNTNIWHWFRSSRKIAVRKGVVWKDSGLTRRQIARSCYHGALRVDVIHSLTFPTAIRLHATLLDTRAVYVKRRWNTKQWIPCHHKNSTHNLVTFLISQHIDPYIALNSRLNYKVGHRINLKKLYPDTHLQIFPRNVNIIIAVQLAICFVLE